MPLDDADKKTIAELIGVALKTNNEELGKSFVTAEGAKKMVEQAVPGALKAAGLDGIGDALKGIQAKLDGEPGKKDDPKGAKDPQVSQLEAKLLALEKKNQEAEQARLQAEQARRDEGLVGQLRAGLGKLNIPVERHDQAIAYLQSIKVDGKPALRFKEDGTPVWTVQRNGYTEDLAVDKALTEWGASEPAKLYLPPKGGTGTGTGAGGVDGVRGSSTAPRTEKGGLDWKAMATRVRIDPTAPLSDDT